MIPSSYQFTCVDRFLRYVTFDTQSSESSDSFPSTLKQKILGEELVRELLAMGVPDACMDAHGYVTGTVPATTSKETVPVIGFISHMDTSPDVSGENVSPVLHTAYDGMDLVLPADPGVVIRVADNPALASKRGETIITANGTTLLGADNKAGIAEIFDAAHFLLSHPEIPHGTMRICITPDEEVGQGTRHFDVPGFGATYAYTVDGEQLGSIENETFCADSLTCVFRGVSIHPGFAKDRLVNSIKVAMRFIEKLPVGTLSPETTSGREGYVHPHGITGGIEETTIRFLLRSFHVEELREQEALLRRLAAEAVAEFPRASVEITVEESYRNMVYVLEKHPVVIEAAKTAMERLGIKPEIGAIRGGTDGARLSYMGLPCPNIFAGEHSFHSKTEWISTADMKLAVQTIVAILTVFEKHAE
jgi:tripeptide aminopeptidase